MPCNSLGAGCNGLGFSKPQREQASSGVIPGNCAGSAPQDLRRAWELKSAGPATGMCSESSYRGPQRQRQVGCAQGLTVTGGAQ